MKLMGAKVKELHENMNESHVDPCDDLSAALAVPAVSAWNALDTMPGCE